MKFAIRISWLCMLFGTMVVSTAWGQTASVSGTVTDADDGLPLPGTNIVIAGTVQGTTTDVDGRYSLGGLAPGSYTLLFSYTGYQNQEIAVTLAAGETHTLDVALQAGIELDPIQVTAGRRQEKTLDAPASIDVLGIREIEQDVSPSSVSALRNTTGVDMAQTGIDRRELVLRGFNNAFSGAAYVLTDYRQSAVPSLGVNIYTIMPNMTVDLERVEVVRGPGSALYGAGVDAGVVHFITKDPFTYPGTTLSVSGGERSLINIQGRHAGVIGEKVGYKITGTYGQADDWELDAGDPIDAVQLAGDVITPRRNDFEKLNLNGTVEARIGDNTSLIFNGGFSQLTATVLSGIGTVQADGFGYTYGQVRFQSGPFFAQAYFNKNSAGDSFVYDTGLNVVDKGALYNAQAQYDLSLADGRENLIIGVDLELTRPDTEGTILGRNEENDDIDEYGAYVQSTTSLSPQFDVILAARADFNSVVDKVQVSPRVGLVLKPTPQHTLRATYNRAFSSPGTNSNFLDILAATDPLIVRGRGAAQGFQWERNPAFLQIGATTDLVASSLNPATLGQLQPVGLPLDATYAAVYAGIAAIPIPVLTGMLQQQGLPVNEQVVGQLVQLLSPQLTEVTGLSPGRMGILDLTTLQVDKFVQDLTDIDPLKQTITQTVEVGYKGLFNDRVLVAVDGYVSTKEDFVGPLLLESPLVFVPTLQGDLQAALGAGIANNELLAGALAQLGLTPELVAGLVVGLAADNLPSATTPVAIVQAKENNPGVGQTPELMLSYRNFGNITYYGVDASIQVLVSDQFNLFGNISWISDDFFDNEELDEEGTDLRLALNAPTFKAKAGASYSHPSGFSVNASGRYTQGFPVLSGPYVGLDDNELDDYFLVDVGAGYAFQDQLEGLRIDVGVSNLLDDDHREFIGAPRLGRVGMARLTYTIQ
ncbi:MAG: TonB-dependent receptor domain-containing protein [Rhodothermales bacterium]